MMPSERSQLSRSLFVRYLGGPSTKTKRICKLTVNQRELGLDARDVRVAIQHRRHTVRRPTGVRHRGLAEERLVHVDLGAGGVVVAGAIFQLVGGRRREALGNVLAERRDLADFLEKDNGAVGRVTIDPNT